MKMRHHSGIGLALAIGLAIAGQPALAAGRISAQIVNMGFQEQNLTVVDSHCGDVVYQGRLEGSSQIEVQLCTDAANHASVSVYDEDSGQLKKKYYGIAEDGEILIH